MLYKFEQGGKMGAIPTSAISESRNHFAYIDKDSGDVMYIQGVDANLARINAAFNSDPIVVIVPKNIEGQIDYNWYYENGEFKVRQ